MSWRTIVISQRCKLDLKMGKLVVRADEIKQVLLDEISIIIVENTSVSITACLLNEIALRITSVVRQYVSKLVFSSEFKLVFSDEIDISMLLLIENADFSSDLVNKIVVDKDFCVI